VKTVTYLITMVYENYAAALRRLQAPFDRYGHWRKVAKTLKLSREACRRLEWLIYYETAACRNASLACRHFGLSRKVFYGWRGRFDPSNLCSLEDRSRAPHRKRRREITPQEESRIIALRKAHIRWGKMKLQRLYWNIYGEPISSWKIQYTIQKYRLYYHPVRNFKLQAKRRRNQAKKRITELTRRPFPGYLIALDCIVVYWFNTKRYILTAIDTVSKIAFARMYTTKSSRSAADFLRRMFYLLDGSVLNALHDNGSEFLKEFIAACRELRIEQYWTRVKTPTDNPMDERFNRTLQEEFIALGNLIPDPVQFNQRLTEWLIEYTFVRPHQALGYDTPWEFYQKTAKVLPMYSSRTRV
jgi:transposase InsO family protein